MDGGLRDSEAADIDEDTRMQWEKGWLWEEALSVAFGNKAAIKPGEVVMDGIIGTPDGMDYDEDGELFVEEYKATAMSSTKSPADMWRWMMQTKGYCRMMGAYKVVFRVLHLSFVPVYRVWEIVFTEAELEENWKAILNQAETMKGGEE